MIAISRLTVDRIIRNGSEHKITPDCTLQSPHHEELNLKANIHNMIQGKVLCTHSTYLAPMNKNHNTSPDGNNRFKCTGA